MSDAGPDKRSFEQINRSDLERLADIACRNLASFFERNPHDAVYQDRLLAIALCQGAAEHYVRGIHGVQDFDVWAFFRVHPSRALGQRRPSQRDFGKSKFGRNPDDKPQFVGRRVDVFVRSIRTRDGEDAASAIRRYLALSKPRSSAWFLAQCPVILLHPETKLGRLIWDPKALSVMPGSEKSLGKLSLG